MEAPPQDGGHHGRCHVDEARLRIAVVGSGVAGLVAAWALGARHDVTVFEAGSAVGGHVRTVALPDGTRVDTGVLLYERRNFPVAHRLLAALRVPVRNVSGATRMDLGPGRSWLSPFGVRDSGHSVWLPPTRAIRLIRIRRQQSRFLRRVDGVPMEALAEESVGAWLADDDLSTWLRLLLMYAYSTPFDETDDLSAALAVPMLVAFALSEQWTAVVGGAERLTAALVAGLPRPVRTGCPVVAVVRGPKDVGIAVGTGWERFDEVVLAAGPDRVLGLLQDPTADERRWFAGCDGRAVQTVVHHDDGPWVRRRLDYRSEFDLFRTADGYGYSACLNRIAGLPCRSPWYGLAFRMGAEIAPSSILHVQDHHVARYTVAALRYREEVRAANGANRTWHAGAWLGDGLQEGAITSGLAVARAFGCPGIG